MRIVTWSIRTAVLVFAVALVVSFTVVGWFAGTGLAEAISESLWSWLGSIVSIPFAVAGVGMGFVVGSLLSLNIVDVVEDFLI